MRRSVLHVSDVLKWADAYRARHGRFPTAKSGVVAEKRDEKWANIEQALSKGLRGFPKGWSLPRLLAERRGHRNRKALPKYTNAQILRWADQHHTRTKRWPISSSGPIRDAKGETWWAVDMALRHGQRGLPGDSSLAQLLSKRRNVRNRQALRRLSVQLILSWADAHKKRTGNWPTSQSGLIGSAPGETWRRIDQALRKSMRGLHAKLSLYRLFLKYRGVGRHVRKPPLSIRQILKWADAHKWRTRRWPHEKSGPIPESHGETWQRVRTTLREGKRGLPGGSTLATLLAEHRGVRNIRALPQLSIKQITSWIHAHYRRLGQLPNRQSGAIAGSSGESWQSVDYALKKGRRGLAGRSSLAKLCRRVKES